MRLKFRNRVDNIHPHVQKCTEDTIKWEEKCLLTNYIGIYNSALGGIPCQGISKMFLTVCIKICLQFTLYFFYL